MRKYQNETIEKVSNLAQRLRLTPESEEEMHDDMLTLKVNVAKERQQEDAQHEHRTEEENVQNDTLPDMEENVVKENVTGEENIAEEGVVGDDPLVGENTTIEENAIEAQKEDTNPLLQNKRRMQRLYKTTQR